MNVVIVEDEAPAFRRLQRILEEVDKTVRIVEVLDSVEESINWFSNNPSPDLVFMDIQLADGLSFEIFESIELQAPVIFTTAYDEYALKAFRVNSIDYLLKPIDRELLAKSMKKLERMKSTFLPTNDLHQILKEIQPEGKTYKSRFLVRSRDKLVSVKTESIAYFFLENGVVYLMTEQGNKFVFDKPLDQIESQLNPEQFFRLNRQLLSNIEAISTSYAYDKGKLMVELQPKFSSTTIVSRERSSEFKRWLDLG